MRPVGGCKIVEIICFPDPALACTSTIVNHACIQSVGIGRIQGKPEHRVIEYFEILPGVTSICGVNNFSIVVVAVEGCIGEACALVDVVNIGTRREKISIQGMLHDAIGGVGTVIGIIKTPGCACIAAADGPDVRIAGIHLISILPMHLPAGGVFKSYAMIR